MQNAPQALSGNSQESPRKQAGAAVNRAADLGSER